MVLLVGSPLLLGFPLLFIALYLLLPLSHWFPLLFDLLVGFLLFVDLVANLTLPSLALLLALAVNLLPWLGAAV